MAQTSNFKNLVGRRFNRLLVLSRAPRKGSHHVRWNCLCDCGNKTVVRTQSLCDGLTRSCGCYRDEVNRKMCVKRRGQKSPLWKGGRFVDKSGYVRLHNPSHPNCDKKGYVAEHVLVMSNFLKRPLEKGELVHHKNGVKNDNRIENLELWSVSHPTGQRVTDLIDAAIEFLSRYGYKVLRNGD